MCNIFSGIPQNTLDFPGVRVRWGGRESNTTVNARGREWTIVPSA